MAAMSSCPPQLAIRQLGPGAISTSQTQTQPATLTSPIRAPVLRLRGAAPREGSGRRISWAEDVIDNEGLGRKKSKACCIYHAPKPIDESSDESSSDDSSTDDDSGVDDGSARLVGGNRRRGFGHDHVAGEGCHGHGKGSAKKGKKRARSPNAYEKMPKAKAPNARSSTAKGL